MLSADVRVLCSSTVKCASLGQPIIRLGLLLGGLLTEHLNWCWTLHVNLVFAALAVMGGIVLLRPGAPTRQPWLDLPGPAGLGGPVRCGARPLPRRTTRLVIPPDLGLPDGGRPDPRGLHLVADARPTDANWTRRAYDSTAAYAHSKRANLMFTYALQRRLGSGAHTIAVASHPGGADTSGSRRSTAERGIVTRALFAAVVRPLLIQSADRGAWPTLRAATDASVAGGEYYGPSGLLESKGHPTTVRSIAETHDEAVQHQRWDLSQELTGVRYPVQYCDRSDTPSRPSGW